MSDGFILTKLVVAGKNVPLAEVNFQEGLNVITGPTNTGKSFIFECIDFVMGAKDLPRDITAAKGYDRIFLELKHGSTHYTIERSRKGGDVRLHTSKYEGVLGAESVVLSAIHDKDNENTISSFLLKLNDLIGIKIRKDKNGSLRSLSYRDICHLLLVSETDIIKKTSPILFLGGTSKTVEANVVKFLVTGTDDGTIIPGPSKEVISARKGKIELLKELMAELSLSNVKLPSQSEIDISLTRIDESIRKYKIDQNQLFQEFTENDALRKELGKNIYSEHERIFTLEEVLIRSALLKESYGTDIRRLKATIEAGILLSGNKNHRKICPYCSTEIDVEIHNESIDKTLIACETEISKINFLNDELEKSVAIINDELGILKHDLEIHQRSMLEIESHLSQNVSAKLSAINSDIDTLTEARSKTIVMKQHALNLEQFSKTKETLVKSLPSAKGSVFDSLTTDIMQPLCDKISKILEAYNYKKLKAVTFSEKTLDLVIDNENRNLEGKGMRAITYATFILGLVEFVNSKTYRIGVPIFDSPLITYSKPQAEGEGISDDLAMQFYRYCAEKATSSQIIILENVEPPANLTFSINHIKFSGIDDIGRKGFIPS